MNLVFGLLVPKLRENNVKKDFQLVSPKTVRNMVSYQFARLNRSTMIRMMALFMSFIKFQIVMAHCMY